MNFDLTTDVTMNTESIILIALALMLVAVFIIFIAKLAARAR